MNLEKHRNEIEWMKVEGKSNSDIGKLYGVRHWIIQRHISSWGYENILTRAKSLGTDWTMPKYLFTDGRVKAFPNFLLCKEAKAISSVSAGHLYPGRPMKARKYKSLGPKLKLSLSKYNLDLARLVLSTFRGFPRDGHRANISFIDGDVSNLSLDNLVWGREGWVSKDNGYRYVFRPGHPNAAKDSGNILEHRLVMSEELGRPLREHEEVHHKNKDRLDNRPENLFLAFDKSHHAWQHIKEGEGLWKMYDLAEKILGREAESFEEVKRVAILEMEKVA